MEFDEFTVSLLVSGPTAMTDALQDAHLAHLAALHDAGSLLAAGPLSDPARELRGLSILSVPVDEARRLKEADDAVRAGVFSVRVMPGASRQVRSRSRGPSSHARCGTFESG